MFENIKRKIFKKRDNNENYSGEKIIYNLKSRNNYFDAEEINLLDKIEINDGILVPYYTRLPLFYLGAALFDKKTNELLYRTANPIFKSEESLDEIKVKLLGENLEFSFVVNENKKIEIFSLDYILGKSVKKIEEKPIIIPKCIIKKADNNPIIRPKFENKWESCGTFNPAVIEIDGITHILYRAVGDDGGSVIGYAISKDGIHIDERLPYPIYKPREEFELRVNSISQPTFSYNSGPRYDCWGGCEDPRIVRLDNKLYMIYTAFNGIRPPCVAMTSIAVEDFLNRKWNKWKKPILVSPEGKMNKNWVIFPEKINGKYAILHSITPNIQIEYLDNLDFEKNPNIKSIYKQYKNKNAWDSIIRGVGPVPLKIDEGWLTFYHAISENEPGKYKIGAMILDYKDPTKILYKSNFPIIVPDKNYENEGYKGGIVYTCGAVIKNKDIILYYGGADTVVCVASCNLKNFIQQIKDNNGKI